MTVDQIRAAAVKLVEAGDVEVFTDPRCLVNNYNSVYRTRGDNTDFSIPVQVWVSVPVKAMEHLHKEKP